MTATAVPPAQPRSSGAPGSSGGGASAPSSSSQASSQSSNSSSQSNSSSAEKTAGPARQPRPRAKRGPVLSPRAGAVLAVVVVVVMVLALPVKTYINQRSRIAQLQSELDWHNQRVAELTAAHKRWKDPAYLEAQARARLHFVRVGQVGYVVLTDAELEESDPTTTRPLAQVPGTGPWWSALWSTVEQASTPKSQQPILAPAPAKAAPSYGN